MSSRPAGHLMRPIGQSALTLLHTAQQPSWEIVLTMFINDLAQLAGQGVLVLEDYHVISAPPDS